VPKVPAGASDQAAAFSQFQSRAAAGRSGSRTFGPAPDRRIVGAVAGQLRQQAVVGRWRAEHFAALNDVYNRKSDKQISGFSRPFILVTSFRHTTPGFSADGNGTGMKALSWAIRDWNFAGVLRYLSCDKPHGYFGLLWTSITD
jgi:hypothetical protein